MKRSSLVRIGVIVAGGIVVSALGAMADGWMIAAGGESIAANVHVVVLVVTVALVGGVLATDRNREVPQADAGTRAEALACAAKEGVARVLLFRDDRMGARIGADVSVDDRLYTQLASPGFTVVDLAPGRHRIAVDFQGQRVEHDLDAQAGAVLALHVRMRVGLASTTPSLEPLEPKAARRRIGSAPMALPVSATSQT